MPESITVEHRADGLRLSYRWFSMMIIFPVFHVAIGVALTYYTLAGFYNRTLISVGRGTLGIEHRPILWFGNRTLQASEISQLYTEQITTRGKNGPRISYQLSAVSQDSRKIKLLTGLESPDSARFIERQVEDWLGIRDKRVEGELPKQRT